LSLVQIRPPAAAPVTAPSARSNSARL